PHEYPAGTHPARDPTAHPCCRRVPGRPVGAQPCRGQAAPHRRHRLVDQTLSEHRAAEGAEHEGCHHRVSQCRAPLSPNQMCEKLWTLPGGDIGCWMPRADRLCHAQHYERSEARRDSRAGHYERKLQTKAREVRLKIPKLRQQTFETAIIERYRRRESSVEEALIEMYLAGVSAHNEGYPEILGICEGAKEDKAGWSAFLTSQGNRLRDAILKSYHKKNRRISAHSSCIWWTCHHLHRHAGRSFAIRIYC